MKPLAVLAALICLPLHGGIAQKPLAPPEITPTPSSSPTPATSPVNSPTPVPAPTALPKPAERPEPTPPSARVVADALSDTEIRDVIEILKKSYLNPAALSENELNRATVQGLVERLAPGATVLAAAKPADESPGVFRSEILDKRLGYLRLSSLVAANVAHLDETLKKFAAQSLGSVIFDLRATPPSSNFELSAEVARRFCPKGQELFTIKRGTAAPERIFTSNIDPLFTGVLIVLIDNETSGAGEVIAAVLREKARAILIGENTTGQAVEFTETPLQSGKVLRTAVAEAVMPNGTRLFPLGVKPDVLVPLRDEVKREIMRQSLETGVSPLLTETERPHMNEAALVAGINPELEAFQAAQRTRGEKPKVVLRDAQLQRAVDLVTTIGIYEKKAPKK